MKHLRLSLAVTALILAFTLPVFAGDMETTVTSQPHTAMAAGNMETTVTATGNTANEVPAADSLAEMALGLMRNVLSLF